MSPAPSTSPWALSRPNTSLWSSWATCSSRRTQRTRATSGLGRPLSERQSLRERKEEYPRYDEAAEKGSTGTDLPGNREPYREQHNSDVDPRDPSYPRHRCEWREIPERVGERAPGNSVAVPAPVGGEVVGYGEDEREREGQEKRRQSREEAVCDEPYSAGQKSRED